MAVRDGMAERLAIGVSAYFSDHFRRTPARACGGHRYFS
jgi:hypothetical protein